MQTFRYRALNRSGDAIGGEVEAADRAAAVAHLQGLGLVPLAAEVARLDSLKAVLMRDFFGERRLSGKELADFFQQLSTLVGASVPVEQALGILTRRQGAPRTRLATQDLLRRLRSGVSLADAMHSDRRRFPSIAIGMVRAGEASGNLESSLARLAEYLRRSENMRQSVYSALVYPAMLVATAFLSVIVILTVVLPQLEPLFVHSGAALPLATTIVIAASDVLRSWWWAMLGGAVGGVLILRRLFSDPSVKLRRDAAILRLPFLGAAVQLAEAARFARTLGTLAGGNVPLPTALVLAQAVLSNAVMLDSVATVTTQLKQGGSLADLLTRAGVFPELSIQLIRVGEATGRLDEMLVKQADLFDADLQRVIERSLAMLVPVITIVLGMIVAAIIASVMVAILSVNDLAA
jgi:general secretion pathway protein F